MQATPFIQLINKNILNYTNILNSSLNPTTLLSATLITEWLNVIGGSLTREDRHRSLYSLLSF